MDRILEFAKQNRKTPTDAEKYVWSKLRNQQLDGHRFRRQHPIGNYIVDFVCLESKLIIELDGGQHAEDIENDRIRTLFLTDVGYRVMRYWNHQVLSDWETVESEIYSLLKT